MDVLILMVGSTLLLGIIFLILLIFLALKVPKPKGIKKNTRDDLKRIKDQISSEEEW